MGVKMPSYPQLFGYSVVIDQELVDDYNERNTDDPDDFGVWSESYINTFKRVMREYSHPDIVSVLDIENNEPCFVLWAAYSSGDSFGTANDKGLDSIAIFKDMDAAQGLLNFLYNTRNNGVFNAYGPLDQNCLKFTSSDGQKHVMRPPWFNSCESLSYLKIEETTLKE